LDNFKKINDFYGHAVGDEVLKKVAEKVRKHLRKTDLFVRWGGEEFAVILPYTDLKGAAKVAEKLRKAIEDLKFDQPYLKVTASFGVTELKPGENLVEALGRADKALYAAKRKGKNRIEVYQA
jgi:diguanylate cyclase (GGDEF)-like protein